MIKMTKTTEGSFSVSIYEDGNHMGQTTFPELLDAIDEVVEHGGETNEEIEWLMQTLKENYSIRQTLLEKLETLALAAW